MKRVGIYVRVSTSEQSTELQQSELQSYAIARGWSQVQIYEDIGVSGTTAHRPQLQLLLRDARSRKIDVILVWKLDRLFRSLKDLITTLTELNEVGVEFVSLKDNIDMTTSTGRLLMHLLGAFAEFEVSIIRERVRAGVANARRKGKILGRPKTVNNKKVIKLREKGLSYRAIQKTLNISAASVRRAIK